jgi:hypothetical protein
MHELAGHCSRLNRRQSERLNPTDSGTCFTCRLVIRLAVFFSSCVVDYTSRRRAVCLGVIRHVKPPPAYRSKFSVCARVCGVVPGILWWSGRKQGEDLIRWDL